MFKDSTLKRHLVSAGLTFLTGFIPVILASIDSLTIGDIRNGAYAGLLIAAIRAGLKVTLESTLRKL